MMVSSYPWWWLALPVLLLPVWWHRQKRQRLKAEALATARFLPSAPPEQLRVWQWRDQLLLLVRCLLLVVLIAWLAATVFPWRGDTVLVDAGADRAWAEQQIVAAGFGGATRMDLPADALQWLRQNEREWRADARLLIVARAGKIAMPARVQQFRHTVQLRTQDSTAAARKAELHVALSSVAANTATWHALFAAFDTAAGAHHALAAEPDAQSSLIVWDHPGVAAPVNWRAPQWWVGDARTVPELANGTALTVNGIAFKYADTQRGRVWSSDAFPPRDAAKARALYEAWQLLASAPAAAYAMPSQQFAVVRSALPAVNGAMPERWLALLLLALFMLERILAHARRN
jgi:hypothetical protein